MFIPRNICSIPLTKGEQDALIERQRQYRIGYSDQHDRTHTDGELARAAACYILAADMSGVAIPSSRARKEAHEDWPFPLTEWNPKSRRENLVRGIALALAELDRIDAEALDVARKG